jgi:TRAP-type C4-dicarboxylate transport system permease small subunit
MLGLSFGRQISLNIPAGDDFASWCMAAMAFLGLAHTFRSGEMIRVGLLIDRFEGARRWYFEMFSLVLGVGFVGFFAWHAVRMTYDSWRFNDISQGVVAVPLWIPQLGFACGLAILFIAFADELVHVARGGTPRYEKPPPASAEEVVERAMQSGV